MPALQKIKNRKRNEADITLKLKHCEIEELKRRQRQCVNMPEENREENPKAEEKRNQKRECEMNKHEEQNELFQLEKVYFFGRTLDEYLQMFNLNLKRIKKLRILDCAAGPASFAGEANWHGIDVVACDPMYDRDLDEVVRIAQRDIECAMNQAARFRDKFSRENEEEDIEFIQRKLRALLHFSQDYKDESARQRYVQASLPDLPFNNEEFDIALCSYLLFFYSDIRDGGVMPHNQLDYEFHRNAVCELLRVVKKEVRIFPLVSPNAERHPYLDRLLDDLEQMQVEWEIVPAAFKDVAAGNKMLVIHKKR